MFTSAIFEEFGVGWNRPTLEGLPDATRLDVLHKYGYTDAVPLRKHCHYINAVRWTIAKKMLPL